MDIAHVSGHCNLIWHGFCPSPQAPAGLPENDAQFYEGRKKKVETVIEETRKSLTGELERINGALCFAQPLVQGCLMSMLESCCS